MNKDLQKIAAARALLALVQNNESFDKTAGIRDRLISMLGGRPARSAGSVLKPLLTALGLGGAGYLGYTHRDELSDLVDSITKRLGLGGATGGRAREGLPGADEELAELVKSKMNFKPLRGAGRMQDAPSDSTRRGIAFQKQLEDRYGIDLGEMGTQAQKAIEQELDALSSGLNRRLESGFRAGTEAKGLNSEQQDLLYKAWTNFLRQWGQGGESSPAPSTPRPSMRDVPQRPFAQGPPML